HQIQQAELTEIRDRRAAGRDQPQPVRADRKSAEQQADQPRGASALQDRRADDDHREQQQELPGAAGRGGQRDRRDDHDSSVLSSGTLSSLSLSETPNHRSAKWSIVPSASIARSAELT